ncbi:hypothetical protein A6302_04354 [Methylobrevis pamukkalensis]|uniref:Uncharacterized protein n=1 Tax=Methylobrevis pamukkalensis TaxID=1439726 RepID=A0A1E3GVJ3_9HYPH|nr:hypothetical protein A6302_04354 [Methylobrevis pamukkalensis]
MVAEGVVVDPPVLDDPSGLSKREEEVLVEAFVTEPTVEALDEGILYRRAGCDVVPFDPPFLAEAQDGMANELRAPPWGNDSLDRFLIHVNR